MANDTDPGIGDLVQTLWRNKEFSDSFSGSESMQISLKLELNIDLSLRRLNSILSDIPKYQQLKVKPKKLRFPRRPTSVKGVGQWWQADLSEMFERDGYKYFLCVVDVFSQKCLTRKLKDKKAVTVADAFNYIFREAGGTFSCLMIETDCGSEFKGNKKFFEKNAIDWKAKRGIKKPSFVEHAISMVRRNLYIYMRTSVNNDWPMYLSAVTNQVSQ
jgi:hypothetical protein